LAFLAFFAVFFVFFFVLDLAFDFLAFDFDFLAFFAMLNPCETRDESRVPTVGARPPGGNTRAASILNVISRAS
jgi:hypothetical protein